MNTSNAISEAATQLTAMAETISERFGRRGSLPKSLTDQMVSELRVIAERLKALEAKRRQERAGL